MRLVDTLYNLTNDYKVLTVSKGKTVAKLVTLKGGKGCSKAAAVGDMIFIPVKINKSSNPAHFQTAAHLFSYCIKTTCSSHCQFAKAAQIATCCLKKTLWGVYSSDNAAMLYLFQLLSCRWWTSQSMQYGAPVHKPTWSKHQNKIMISTLVNAGKSSQVRGALVETMPMLSCVVLAIYLAVLAD